jgi:hypothetical protein
MLEMTEIEATLIAVEKAHALIAAEKAHKPRVRVRFAPV